MSAEQSKYDIIVIGAACAGFSAALYAARRGFETLVISADIGGQASITEWIENYPGIDGISGPDLMEKFRAQARMYGAELLLGKVVKLTKNTEQDFSVALSDGHTFKCRAVILCFGKAPKDLNIPGEDKFIGHSIYEGSFGHAEKFVGRTVAVIGGGNSGAESAYVLSKHAKKVYLIHRRDELRAEQILIDRMKERNNIEFILSHIPVEIKGDKHLESIVIQHTETKQTKEIKVDGIFVTIGYEVKTGFIANLVKLSASGEIIIDDRNRTNCQGIYAAGDVTTIPYKQAVISAGEGAKAAMECCNILAGGKAQISDWLVTTKNKAELRKERLSK